MNNKLSALLFSRMTGKTLITKHLETISDDLIFIDIDEKFNIVKYKTELDYLHVCKEYVDDLMKDNEDKRFFIILESKEQSEYFDIKDEQCFVFSPSNNFFESIKKKFETTDHFFLENERKKLLNLSEDTKVNYYNSFTNLFNIIKKLIKN